MRDRALVVEIEKLQHSLGFQASRIDNQRLQRLQRQLAAMPITERHPHKQPVKEPDPPSPELEAARQAVQTARDNEYRVALQAGLSDETVVDAARREREAAEQVIKKMQTSNQVTTAKMI